MYSSATISKTCFALVVGAVFLMSLLSGVNQLVNGGRATAWTRVTSGAATARTGDSRPNSYRRCWGNDGDGRSTVGSTTPGDIKLVSEIVRHPPCKGLKTLEEIMDLAELPCNYVHDGYYLMESNFVLEEVYSALEALFVSERDPSKIVPVIAEIGGHDGITKSNSLKPSRCLHANTLLIEASPSNYNVLRKARAYDTTVNAALCDGDYVNIHDNPTNSGETKIVNASRGATARVPCTTLDDEIEAMRRTMPNNGRDFEMRLVFLVLDVEGNEGPAIKGISKYLPSKAMIETKFFQKRTANPVKAWAKRNGWVVKPGGSDTYINFAHQNPTYPRNVFYGARKSVPQNKYMTSLASLAYMYYGA